MSTDVGPRDANDLRGLLHNRAMSSPGEPGPPVVERRAFSCQPISIPRQFRAGLIELRGPNRELIATDARVVLRSSDRRDGTMRTQWEAPYAFIDRYWSVFTFGGESSPNLRRVTLIVGGQSFTFKMRSRDGVALLKVLGDRAPEAVRVSGLRKYRALDVVMTATKIAAAAVVVLGFVHHQTAASSASHGTLPTLGAPSARELSAGECPDPLGRPTRCGSDLASYVIARCSDVTAADHDVTAAVAAEAPELTQVIRLAAGHRLCAKVEP